MGVEGSVWLVSSEGRVHLRQGVSTISPTGLVRSCRCIDLVYRYSVFYNKQAKDRLFDTSMPCKLGLFSTYLPLNPWSGPFSPDPVKRVRSVSELALTALRSLCNIHKALLLLIFFTSKLKAEPIILRVFFGAAEKLTCFTATRNVYLILVN